MNIVRNSEGTVTFPAEIMELVEHISFLVMEDAKVKAFIEANAGERDAYGWTTLLMGMSISQCS